MLPRASAVLANRTDEQPQHVEQLRWARSAVLANGTDEL